jgi:diguanylate cyclase (GGDEF)-like protein
MTLEPKTINAKIFVFFSVLMGFLILVLVALSLYSFQRFSLYTAERHARSVAEAIKVGLTESMVNGTINKRPEFLQRLSNVPGVQNVRIIRGAAVDKQFGPGLELERPLNDGESSVISHGEPVFNLIVKDGATFFHAIIPYTANGQGTPNCLQCHLVAQGTVLGAVAIHIPLDEVKYQAITTVALMALIVFLTAMLALFVLRRVLRPLVETTHELKSVVDQAVGGVFNGRIVQRSSDEVGEIADQLNRLMGTLEEGISTIGSRVGELMNYQPKATGNQLTTTIEMVEILVEAARYKKTIEEDMGKLEVYQRLARVLTEKFDIVDFSIYEVASSKNRIVPIIVDNEFGAPCHWCDQQILIDANTCRVKRTGHTANAVEFPEICTMFRGDVGEDKHTHICMPITQSGSVGCVVQLVLSADLGQYANYLLPFIVVYLRETAPVIEAKRLMDHLKESTLRDAMTGLYNRRFLEEYVTTLVATSQRRNTSFSILMLDLDYFKQVNDTFGHEAGDKVLKTLAETLSKSVRSSDMVVRYGGEEFLIILMDTEAQGAMQIAENIRAKVEDTKISLPGTMLQKTISIGVSEFPLDADTFWQVVKYADVALYEAKTQGRNRVLRFDPVMWKEVGNY